MKTILESYEAVYVENQAKLSPSAQLPRLFSLCPLPSFNWRFIAMNAELLASLFPSVRKPDYPAQYAAVFHQVFNFDQFGFQRYVVIVITQRYCTSTDNLLHSHEQLMLDPRKMFANKILTDGSSVSFGFSRKAKPHDQGVELELTDFTLEEVTEIFNPCAVDPGRTNAFTAAYGFGDNSHTVVNIRLKSIIKVSKNQLKKRSCKERRKQASQRWKRLSPHLKRVMKESTTSTLAMYLHMYLLSTTSTVPKMASSNTSDIKTGKRPYLKPWTS